MWLIQYFSSNKISCFFVATSTRSMRLSGRASHVSVKPTYPRIRSMGNLSDRSSHTPKYTCFPSAPQLSMDTHPPSPRTELELITEQELALHLKICRRQLYNWRVGGLIPYFKLGKAVRFRVADVAAAIERMRVG
ncbi:MAG: DNA-binding protein [Planctomycetia bacterium]|nr:DNA-binding protein [Planctomycetia bacterium]